MAGSDRSKWIGPCRQALIHLLLLEHWFVLSIVHMDVVEHFVHAAEAP